MKPPSVVAVVGRPNVGKSTLFNRITGRRRAIVHETAGVTRDAQRGMAEWNGVGFQLVDTGGLFSGIEDELIASVESHALREAQQADAILFVTDAASGPIAADIEVATRVREMGLPVLVVANKAEKQVNAQASGEFFKLGFDHVYPVSALHGDGVGDLLDDLVALLPRQQLSGDHEDLRLALIGVPNVGKSSLVNAIVGSETNIVDSRPGTTRDSIDVTVRWEGKAITLVDTAGIKRRSRTEKGVDTISAVKSLESIERCDVAVVVLDGARPLTTQDVKVASYAHEAGRGVVVVFNKWDLVDKKTLTYRDVELRFRDRCPFLNYAPVQFVSALTHQRLNRVIETAWKVRSERERRVPTAEFNRFIEALLRRNPPPYHSGGNGKIYYGTQVETAPPTFSLFVNSTRHFGRNYLRFLNHQVREAFGFKGTQIRIHLVEKKRNQVSP